MHRYKCEQPGQYVKIRVAWKDEMWEELPMGIVLPREGWQGSRNFPVRLLDGTIIKTNTTDAIPLVPTEKDFQDWMLMRMKQ